MNIHICIHTYTKNIFSGFLFNIQRAFVFCGLCLWSPEAAVLKGAVSYRCSQTAFQIHGGLSLSSSVPPETARGTSKACPPHPEEKQQPIPSPRPSSLSVKHPGCTTGLPSLSWYLQLPCSERIKALSECQRGKAEPGACYWGYATKNWKH